MWVCIVSLIGTNLEAKARCIGSDGYRRLKGPVCTNRPVRQDSLDKMVWDEIIQLLDDPSLIQDEIDRRRKAAQEANPLRKREEELRREQARLEKNSERLISAYQESLVSLPQLRQRMPELNKQIHAVEAELHSLEMAAVDDARYLQLAETLAVFRGKLRTFGRDTRCRPTSANPPPVGQRNSC